MRTIHDDDSGSNGSPPRDARADEARSRDALTRRTDELEAVLAAGGVGFCYLDLQLRPIGVSSQLKALFGWPPDAQLEWAHLEERIHPQDRAALLACLRSAFEEGVDFDVVVRTAQAPGAPERIALQGRAIYDDDGVCGQIVLIAREAGSGPPERDAAPGGVEPAGTGSEETGSESGGSEGTRSAGAGPEDASPREVQERDAPGESASKQDRERLALAMQAAGLGDFEWNTRTGQIVWSGRHAELLGLPRERRTAYVEDWLACVHSADRSRLEHELRAAAAGASQADVEYRVIHGDGSERWLSTRCRLYRDPDGLLSRLIGVTQDITALKERELELAAALERRRELHEAADAASRAKDEFLSVISHELRSPLNAILGWNRILTIKRGDDPDVAAIAPRIEQAAKAQLKLVNDLLDMGRIATGQLRIDPRPMKLAAVVAAAIDAARPAAAAKGLTITSELAQPGEIYGDPDRLLQVVSNLLSNAIKFTGSGGSITVTLNRTDHIVELVVEDTGRGIPPELLPHVFDRFRQADTSTTTRRAGGLGLGLMLVREIVSLHGGRVSARSEGLGRGSTFIVALPAAPARTTARRDLDPNPRHDGKPRVLSGLSILIVDDEPDARALVAETLRLEGAHVTVTESAGAAYRELQENGGRFDVIVTDIGMPEEDGYSLVRKLRRMRQGADMLAIALTGFASRSDAEAALDAGFDLHVAKPVDFDTFVPTIRRLASEMPRRPPR